MKIVLLIHDGFEDLEYFVPKYVLEVSGYETLTVGIREGKECKGKWGLTAKVEKVITDVQTSDIEGIIVPGAYAPDKLRRYAPVLKLVKDAYEAGKLVCMSCHGGQVGISANIVKGHHATGSWGIKDDLINAGAIYEDKPCVVDGNIIWAQGVRNLVEYCQEILKYLKRI